MLRHKIFFILIASFATAVVAYADEAPLQAPINRPALIARMDADTFYEYKIQKATDRLTREFLYRHPAPNEPGIARIYLDQVQRIVSNFIAPSEVGVWRTDPIFEMLDRISRGQSVYPLELRVGTESFRQLAPIEGSDRAMQAFFRDYFPSFRLDVVSLRANRFIGQGRDFHGPNFTFNDSLTVGVFVFEQLKLRSYGLVRDSSILNKIADSDLTTRERYEFAAYIANKISTGAYPSDEVHLIVDSLNRTLNGHEQELTEYQAEQRRHRWSGGHFNNGDYALRILLTGPLNIRNVRPYCTGAL